MADLSNITLPNGDNYNLKDLVARTIGGSMDPILTKSYTGVIATANNQADGNLYAIKVVPDNYNNSWTILYKVTATIAGVSEANGSGYEESYVYIHGMRDSFATYWTWNNIRNTTYRPYYYHPFYRAKAAGITGGYGHILGIALRSSWNPATAANVRTITFDILDYKDCTISFFDAMTKYASVPGTGSTNYSALSEFDGTTQGITVYGDRNNYDRLLINDSAFKCGSTAIVNSNIIVADSDGLYKHLKTGTAFDLRFPILFASSNVNANALITNAYMAFPFNVSTTQTISLTQGQAVFVKGQLSGTIFTPVSTTPLTQTLPSTADGYEYIRLGHAYSGTAYMWLEPTHPIFAYRNGKWREVVGDAETVNGRTVSSSLSDDTTIPTGYAVQNYTNSRFVRKDAELLTTNPFAPPSMKGPYISKIDDAFYVADKRFNVSATIDGTAVSSLYKLFNGNYEEQTNIPVGKSIIITIDCTNDASGYFPGYPYGYILVSFYHTGIPVSVSGRVYCNYEPHTIGWHDISFSPVSDSGSSNTVYRGYNGVYNISKFEITVTAGSDLAAKISEIEMHLNRPNSSRTPFLSKYAAETLYYPLTAPSFVGDLTGSASKVNNHTVNSDVPSNAVFTDTKDLTQMTGTLSVSHGGTGATTLTSGAALIGNGTGAVTTRAIRNHTSTIASIGWTNLEESTQLLTQNDIAYWNGRYNDTSSNLKYASVGELKAAATYEVETAVANDSKLPTGAAVKSFVEGKGYVTTDTKNTTGSTDTSSKIFLVGATSQAANPQTYSDNEVYATNGKLSMKEAQIGGDSGPIARYNTTTKSLDFVFS